MSGHAVVVFLFAGRAHDCIRRLHEVSAFRWAIIANADELLAYGIYRLLARDLAKVDKEEQIENAYNKALDAIASITEYEERQAQVNGRQFSFNSYFKKPKCRYDLNRKMGWDEDDNIARTLMEIL